MLLVCSSRPHLYSGCCQSHSVINLNILTVYKLIACLYVVLLLLLFRDLVLNYLCVGVQLKSETEQTSNVTVHNKRGSWYSSLCNRWLSLFGVSLLSHKISTFEHIKSFFFFFRKGLILFPRTT